MRASTILFWLITIVAAGIMEFAHKTKVSPLYDVLSLFYFPLFIISTYLFFSISSVKNKAMLDSFLNIGDFLGKYLMAIIALFSAYLLLASDSIAGLGYSVVFGTIWYSLISLFILVASLLPATKLFLQNDKSNFPKIYFALIILVFGWGFSALTGIIGATKLHIPTYWDAYTFLFISFIEEFILIAYTLFFFKLQLKPTLR